MRIERRRWLVLALAATLAPVAAYGQSEGFVVFAAASLKNALDEVAATWAKDTGKPMPRISYAATSALARQIERGAPAEIFVSADVDWMDYLAGKKLIKVDSRVNLLGNKLVLIASDGSNSMVELTAESLAKALGNGRLAMASIDAVPAGKYGKAALETLGAWNAIKDKVAQTENVRAALRLVARGEAPLGIVYRTDAIAEPDVRIVATFPDGSHPPIVYPAARMRDSRSASARLFLEHLHSIKAMRTFEKHGFRGLAQPTSRT